MMCHLTTIVSGAVSLGVLAGVLSGIVYVVLVGLKWVGKLRVSLEEEALKGRRDDRVFTEGLCTKCRTWNGALSNGSAGSEDCCDNSACDHSICSESANHLKKRGSRRISEIWSEEKDADVLDGEDSNDAKTIRIREEIEKLVEEMVGGSLDGVSVGKLSKHSSYLAMFAKHHEPICQALAKLGYALHTSFLNKKGLDSDSPRVAQSTLKALVERVVREAMKLPNISEILHGSNCTEDIGNDNNFSNKSYEDILATAILNKVIEKYQKGEGLASSKQPARSGTKTARNRNNNIVNNEDEEDDNDIVYNSDWSDTSRSEQLSLTIEEHIEEITTTYENSEEDEELNEEMDYNGAIPFPESGRIILDGDRGNSEEDGDAQSSATEIITTGNSWEENWLFQRKKLRSGAKSHHPVPVPMLVPNPSQDFRALIGGVDADDLSDMSECEDSVLEDIVLAADDEKDHPQGEEVEEGTVINSKKNNRDGGNEITEMAEVDESVIDAVGSPMSLNSELSCPSLSQKERDVSVDYECFRKFQIELRDPPLTRPGSLELPIVDSEEYNTPITCRIAVREKEKWNHAVPLADNPYSAENILKREQRKKMEYFRTGYRSGEAVEFPSDSPEGIGEEPAYEIYSRDYYIKASRCPTGDPNLRLAPETEVFESSEEVSQYLRRGRNRNDRERNRFPFSESACDCLSEAPVQTELDSSRKRKNHTKTLPRSFTENSYRKYGSYSLRLPSQQRRRNHIMRGTGELDNLEEITLKENIAHVIFRAKNATPNFIINPLFEDNPNEKERVASGGSPPSLDADTRQQKQSRSQESGYGSDAHDCSSDSSEFWRLTPPETPEMLESSLITTFQLRRNNREKRFFGTFPKSRESYYL